MKKEAINTFGEGLIMDLHPLTTPNNVLTNCLNGTIITYNGNEFVLQNDMGNGEVHTAYLDKGYVPVGMKEHGGIIYVAAHNPITGKSQIGSFPSPQQLYEGDDLNVAPIKFDFSEFVEVKEGVPFIKLEYFKQKLFQVNNSDEVKIFHPGDKFVVITNVLDTVIRDAINNGTIRLRLGVINSSGNIDYIDENNLRTYTNGLWIYENSNTPIEDVLKSKDLVQVFSAKSSGALILIIEMKTFDTFNLIRKYSYDETKGISVEFSGETKGNFKGTTKVNTDNIALYQDGSTKVESTIIKTGKTGTTSYKIMPACPYGVLERMSKSGTIDFDAIRTNSELLSEWRFYVTDTYLKIGWGYDYYNLNEDSDIDKIEFTFISLTNSGNVTNLNDVGSLVGDYSYVISKEYYNGSFEEIIPFDNNTIQKNWIYIIRIDRYVNGVKKNIGYKLVYTSGYFNDSYEEVSDFNKDLPSGAARSKISLGVKNNISASVKRNGIPSLTLQTGTATSATSVSSISASQYVSEVASLDTDVSKYKYETGKVGKYDVNITLDAGYDYKDKIYAGNPDESLISNYFGTNPSISSCTFDDSKITTSNDSTLSASISNPSSKIATNFSWNSNKLSGQLSTSRYIYANAGAVTAKSIEQETLRPAFEESMDLVEREKLFSFGEENGTLKCVLASDKNMEYNCTVTADGGAAGSGQNSGAGVDDTGLQTSLANMGNGTVGIFGGKDKDSASLRFGRSRRTINGWSCGSNEVDNHDNFLMATWKDTNGIHNPVNLASRRVESGGLLRVDKMLKCILSQLLILKKVSKSANIVGPNNLNYVYHTSFPTLCDIKVAIPNGGTDVDVNFYLGSDTTTIENHMKKWTSIIPDFKNYLPIFQIHKNTALTTTISIGEDLDFSKDADILNCYTNAYSAYTLKSDTLNIDKNKIYVADPSVGYTVNTDGSITFNSISPKLSNILVNWNRETWTFNDNFNTVFITKYAYEHQSNIQDGYYNEILVRSDFKKTARGTWTRGNDSDAPDIASNVLYSSKTSIYNKN